MNKKTIKIGTRNKYVSKGHDFTFQINEIIQHFTSIEQTEILMTVATHHTPKSNIYIIAMIELN